MFVSRQLLRFRWDPSSQRSALSAWQLITWRFWKGIWPLQEGHPSRGRRESKRFADSRSSWDLLRQAKAGPGVFKQLPHSSTPIATCPHRHLMNVLFLTDDKIFLWIIFSGEVIHVFRNYYGLWCTVNSPFSQYEQGPMCSNSLFIICTYMKWESW